MEHILQQGSHHPLAALSFPSLSCPATTTGATGAAGAEVQAAPHGTVVVPFCGGSRTKKSIE